jgi:hypothetical protein
MGKNATDDIATVLSLYAHVFNFTNMHVMFHRSDFAHASRSNVDSVSNGTRLPGCSPGWNRPEGPCPGQELPSNLSRSVLAGLLPGQDINPRFFGRVEPGPQFHITVHATLAPIKHSSSDRITI